MRRKQNTLTENKIHSQKTEYTRRKQNTLAENKIHSQKTEYIRRKQNTHAENRIHSQKTEYTRRKQNTLSYYIRVFDMYILFDLYGPPYSVQSHKYPALGAEVTWATCLLYTEIKTM